MKTKSRATRKRASRKSKSSNKYFNFSLGTVFYDDDNSYADIVLHCIPAPSSDGRWRMRVWLESSDDDRHPSVQGSLPLSKKKSSDDDDDDDDE